MIRPSLCLAALLLAPSSGLATNTLCDFHATDASRYYSIEILGPLEPTMIQVNHPASERQRRLGPYVFRDFSLDDVRIDLVHTGLDAPDAMPSFTLKGRKDHVVMTIEGRRIVGKMKCQWELDAEMTPPKRTAIPKLSPR
jgi:hypothetical protein